MIDRVVHGPDRELNLALLEELCDTMINGSLMRTGRYDALSGPERLEVSSGRTL